MSLSRYGVFGIVLCIKRDAYLSPNQVLGYGHNKPPPSLTKTRYEFGAYSVSFDVHLNVTSLEACSSH
jgi:hypothetical protein